MSSCYPCVLTIAGSDSSGGAGIQADIKTFAAHGVYGASVITAITAQNTTGVRAIHPVPVDIVAAQIDAVLEDLPIAAVKIGMLSSAEIVTTVADRLRAHHIDTIVLDTVIAATAGKSLLHDAAITTMTDQLFPLATVITPNLPEAARLLESEPITDPISAATALLRFGSRAVLLKGGHGERNVCTDYLVQQDRRTPLCFCYARVETPHTHGTGCSLSAAIAANLAKGYTLERACEEATSWVHHAISAAWPLGKGHGPIHHFWQVWPTLPMAGCDEA